MENSLADNPNDRQKLVQAARVFKPQLADPALSEEEIDAAIEELRPLRMHIHAIDYGDAPGFRRIQKVASDHR